MRLLPAAVSDVGRVRKDNQDSGYAGPNLLVVADGVGGAARGDLASSTAVRQLMKLDEPPREPEDASGDEHLLEALTGAISLTHERIVELVREDPEVEGTSTTLTAAYFDGRSLAVAHVGDSRAYLLREGELSQLTTDHTFVQSLVDEGRITEDEARVHPHRNLILRAVDGVHQPEPDLFTVELHEGDRVMLCSDGCCGVLDHAELTRRLGEGTPEYASVDLVRASLDAGSTDNVTVIVADVIADDAVVDPESASEIGPLLVGAVAESPRRWSLSRGRRPTGEIPVVPGDPDDPDAPRGTATDQDPEALRYAPREPGRFLGLRRIVLAVLVLGLLALAAGGAYRWTQQQYYVSDSDGQVAIFRGPHDDVLGMNLNHVVERSDIKMSYFPEFTAKRVRNSFPASDLGDAQRIVENLRTQAICDPALIVPPTPAPAPGKPGKPGVPGKAPGKVATPSPVPTTPSAPTGLPPECGDTP